MFVGEQRYVEKHIGEFMEFYKKSLNVEEDNYATTQAQTKGGNYTKTVDEEQKHKDDDPDQEENKKFDREVEKSSSEEEKQEEPEDSDEESYEDDDAPAKVSQKLVIERPISQDKKPRPMGKLTNQSYDDDSDDEGHNVKAGEKYKVNEGGSNLRLGTAGSSNNMPGTGTPSSRSKLIEKNASGAGAFRGDTPSMFNRSKLGDSKRMDYDDDAENLRYVI